MKKWMRRSFAFLSVWGIAACVPSAHAWTASAAEIVSMVDPDNLYFDVEHLSQMPRIAATESEFVVASYIERRLRSYGYVTRLVPFFYYEYLEPKSLILQVSGMKAESWNLSSLTYASSGQGSGSLLDCGYGTEEGFRSRDARGKVALIKRGKIPFSEKVRNAAAAGAVAAILVNDRPDHDGGTLGEPLDAAVPVVMVTQEDGIKLRERLKESETLQVTVKVDGASIVKRTSYNVEAVRKPSNGNTQQIVVVGAHHDTAPGSPGANDNASGVAVLLETARLLAEQPIDTEVRLVSFGASERGQRGSAAYVQGLSPDVKSRMAAVFQLERMGSENAGDLIMDTANGKPNLVTELGNQAGAALSPVGKDSKETASDHLPFAAAGIPAALFLYAPAEIRHPQPEDTINDISKENLLRAAQTIGMAVCEIVSPETPAFAISKQSVVLPAEMGNAKQPE
ncbi:M28 family peptidase [Brevibacillus sp. H7]|uniref:M28 family peptidase n=1 Tax=Brevibacillus sp. H7 TaxID=3349138 RepID=UPI003807C961